MNKKNIYWEHLFNISANIGKKLFLWNEHEKQVSFKNFLIGVNWVKLYPTNIDVSERMVYIL